MKNNIDLQLKHLEKQEQKILNKSDNTLINSKISPLVNKVQDKIPKKLKSILNMSFYKGFQLVFEKGSPYIEKTYNKEKIMMDYDVNNYAVGREFSKRHVKRLDKQSKQSGIVNTSFSAIEGGVLGLLGIGLPDIPLFLSVMVKTIYEIALSYGFPYDTEAEESYLLLLISVSISKNEKKKELTQELDQLGAKIDQCIVIEVNPESQMKLTSERLSDALLTAKFIQGIPIVGVVGGAVNYTILNKVSACARIKYKQRYLLKKRSE